MATLEDMLQKRRSQQVAYNKTDKRKAKDKRYRSGSTYKRATKPIKFVDFKGWDGEGTGEGVNHKYVLLMNSENDSMYNPDGLTSMECFNFLCDSSLLYGNSTHIIFSGSYDVNMMLRDVPFILLERLHKTGRVYWKNFSLEYHPKKFFQIKRYEPNTFIHKRRGRFNASIILWDVFGFFQSSFLKALDDFFTLAEKEEMGYQLIKEGKERRSTFTPEEIESYIIPYTRRECNALVRLMSRLYNEYCHDASIRLRRFDGAGAIAHSVLTKHHVKDHYAPIPDEIMTASQHAYGGGRIEIIQFGLCLYLIYHYDINSAYPSIIVDLPSLAGGKWIHRTYGSTPFSNMLPDITPHTLYRVIWDYRTAPIAPFYPFFYRSWPQGDITFPNIGHSWVWDKEVAAALKWNDVLKGHIRVLESYQFVPANDVKPYAFVHDMYEERKRLKAQGHGMHVVYKLGYNSFYGKTVQHLGYEDHQLKGETKWRPPFFQLQYGGMITSGIRAKMFDAAMQAPGNIIAFATDGLWSTAPLDVPIGTSLGEWEYEELNQGTFVQSGVYWTHDKKGGVTQHYRGFDKEELTEEKVINAWKQGLESIPILTTRFITLGQGLSFNNKELWHTWYKQERVLDLYPNTGNGKRESVNTLILAQKEKRQEKPHEGLILTIPNSDKVVFTSNGIPQISEPFPLPWSHERVEYNRTRQAIEQERLIQEAIEEKYE